MVMVHRAMEKEEGDLQHASKGWSLNCLRPCQDTAVIPVNLFCDAVNHGGVLFAQTNQ